jgi:hypothetical protein
MKCDSEDNVSDEIYTNQTSRDVLENLESLASEGVEAKFCDMTSSEDVHVYDKHASMIDVDLNGGIMVSENTKANFDMKSSEDIHVHNSKNASLGLLYYGG